MPRGHHTPSQHPVAVRRIAKGLTRSQLSEQTGVAFDTIARWEQGSRSIRNSPCEIVVRVAKVLKCKPEELFEEVKGEGK